MTLSSFVYHLFIVRLLDQHYEPMDHNIFHSRGHCSFLLQVGWVPSLDPPRQAVLATLCLYYYLLDARLFIY